ncbi:MAG: hypothetical protein H7331_08890 [Bacteroidia bacterium]|nr:hypothetical protein [Bacteroidia bacterium]
MEWLQNKINVKDFWTNYKHEIGLIIALYIMYLFVCPIVGHGYDTYCWREWTKLNFQGLSGAYDTWNEYPPAYQHFLYLFAKIQGSVESINENMYQLKFYTLLFDFAGPILCFICFKKAKTDFYKLLFALLNVAYLYNTLIWGQVDSIFTFFCFAAIIAALYKRVYLTMVLYILAFGFKVQAIIFFPLIGILLANEVFIKFKIIDYLKLLAVCVITIVLIVLPFYANLPKMWEAISGSVDRCPVLSMNAYNLWHLLPISGHMIEVKDATLYAGISYKNWGMLLFFIGSTAALLPFTLSVVKNIAHKKAYTFTTEQVLLVGALIPLLFFFFNTQMHERYSHPAFLFIIAYNFVSGKQLPTLLFSVSYFLNMEGVLQFLRLHNYGTLIFNSRFIAILFLLTIGVLFRNLYISFKKTNSLTSALQ